MRRASSLGLFVLLLAAALQTGCDETHELRFNNRTSLDITVQYSVEKQGDSHKTEREGSIFVSKGASAKTGSVIFFAGRFLRVRAFSDSAGPVFESVYSYDEAEAADFKFDITTAAPP